MVIYQMLRKAPVLRVWRVFFVARPRAGRPEVKPAEMRRGKADR